MRVLATADNHFVTGPRWEETLRIHDWIAEQVEELRPDAVLLGGDLFDRRSTAAERSTVADWLIRLADVAPVVGAKGNHSIAQNIALFSKLRATHPIIMEEGVGVHYVAGAAIAVVAWPEEARLAAALPAGAPVAAAGREALQDVLRGLGAELALHDGPRILLGHLQVTGSKVGTGQPLAVGAEIDASLADVALAGADAAIFGHIHMAQHWEHGGAPIIYPGSPYRTDFGESEEKSIVLLDIRTAGRRVEWSRIPTPATPMLLIEGKVSDLECPDSGEDFRGIEVDHNPSNGELAGAEIRLRYAVAAGERELAARSASDWKNGWIGRGAASVKVEERVIPQTRARAGAAEVAAATGLEAKLRGYWSTSRPDLDTERTERLLRVAADIEKEASHG